MVVALAAAGGVLVFGAGLSVVVGGLLWIRAANEDSRASTDAQGATTHAGEVATTEEGTTHLGEGTTGELGVEGASASEESADSDDSDEHKEGIQENGQKSGQKGVKQASAPSAASNVPSSSAKGPQWFCNASGSVLVCGFANVCNHQMVFGSGFGSERIPASMMAKTACEGMARAKGGSTVCVVSCSLR